MRQGGSALDQPLHRSLRRAVRAQMTLEEPREFRWPFERGEDIPPALRTSIGRDRRLPHRLDGYAAASDRTHPRAARPCQLGVVMESLYGSCPMVYVSSSAGTSESLYSYPPVADICTESPTDFSQCPSPTLSLNDSATT